MHFISYTHTHSHCHTHTHTHTHTRTHIHIVTRIYHHLGVHAHMDTLYSILVTGRTSNKWSNVTLRVAMAIFSRSPAAYRALKALRVLQLPCDRTLRHYMQRHSSHPGINEDLLHQAALRYSDNLSQRENAMVFHHLYNKVSSYGTRLRFVVGSKHLRFAIMCNALTHCPFGGTGQY